MAFDKVIDSAKLDAGMTATANAIRAKTGGTSPIAWDSADGFRGAVEAINTEGGVELPELNEPAEPGEVFSGKEYIDGSGQKKTGSFTIDDELTEQDSLISQIANALKNKAAGSLISLPELANPAAPTDMVAGKELYDDEGNLVTGTLHEVGSSAAFSTTEHEVGGTVGGDTFNVAGVYSNLNVDGIIVRSGSRLGVKNVPTSLLGDAMPEQVAKGAKFTSAAGYLAEGTYEPPVGGNLPALDNPASASDLALDKQLIDANGNVVTGTLAESEVGTKVMAGDDIVLVGTSGDTVFSIGGVYGKRYIDDDSFHGFICRPGTNFYIRNAQTSLFGNATGEYVAKGKTFTSEAGLLAEGELEEIEAGKIMSAKEDITVNRNSDGTIAIYAKTNFDLPGAIVRSGAYLRITVPISVFDGIFGGTDDVTIDGETLVFSDVSTASIDGETLIV